MLAALVAEGVPALEQGSVQFVLFGLMVLGVFLILWISLAR